MFIYYVTYFEQSYMFSMHSASEVVWCFIVLQLNGRPAFTTSPGQEDLHPLSWCFCCFSSCSSSFSCSSSSFWIIIFFFDCFPFYVHCCFCCGCCSPCTVLYCTGPTCACVEASLVKVCFTLWGSTFPHVTEMLPSTWGRNWSPGWRSARMTRTWMVQTLQSETDLEVENC